jgi:hypothetical protein
VQAEFVALRDSLAREYPDRACLWFEYNEPLSHLIYAGSDMFLVPSIFEPCGLTQMIAMNFGTVPVVRKTGGLADTVFDVDHDEDRAEAAGEAAGLPAFAAWGWGGRLAAGAGRVAEALCCDPRGPRGGGQIKLRWTWLGLASLRMLGWLACGIVCVLRLAASQARAATELRALSSSPGLPHLAQPLPPAC